MPGHVSYPRSAAEAEAWSNFRNAQTLVVIGQIDEAIEALEKLLQTADLPEQIREEAEALLRELLPTRPTGELGGTPSGEPKDVTTFGETAHLEYECARLLARYGYRIEVLKHKKEEGKP